MSIYGSQIPKTEEAILREAYYGKQKELIEIENLIEDMRKRIMGQKDFNLYTGTFSQQGIYTYVGELSYDKNIPKINRLFEKVFGFHSFGLSIIPSNSINAFTYPVGAKLDSGHLFDINKIKNFTIVDRHGMRFKPDNNLCVLSYIYSGLIFNPRFTASEILAIILHEIGHNFADAVSPIVAVNNCALLTMQLGLMILNIFQGLFSVAIMRGIDMGLNGTNFMSEMITKGTNMLTTFSTNNLTKQYFTLFSGIHGLVQDIRNMIMPVIAIIQLPYRYMDILMQKAMNLLMHFSGKHNERIADNFATSYGYGAELSSALSKMELEPNGMIEKEVQKYCPLLGAIVSTPLELLRFTLMILDVHPFAGERVKNQLDTLKYELKNAKNLDPKVKKDIQDQIKSIEDIEKKMLEQKSKMPTENIYWMRRSWFESMIKSTSKLNDLEQQQFNTNLDIAVDKLRIGEGADLIGMKRRFELL